MAMISTQTVTEYLRRPLKDSDLVKRRTKEELTQLIERLAPGLEVVYPMYQHQMVTFLLGLKFPGYGIFLDPGLGKSKVMLDLFSYLKKTQNYRRMLVVVPNTVLVPNWIEQCHTHAPKLKAAGGAGSFTAVAGFADVVIVTYATLLRWCCSKQAVIEYGDKAPRNKLVVDEVLIAKVARDFDTVVYDESPMMLRNHTSTSFRVCKKIAGRVKRTYCLTGTPFSKDPEDLWSQFNIIDGGETLGALGLFRAAFFTQKRDYWSGGLEYKFDRTKEPQLRRTLRHRSIYYSETECQDLPECVPMVREVTLTKEHIIEFERLLETFKTGDHVAVKNNFIRMRQLSSGYLTVRDKYADDENERIEVTFKTNPKLEALFELIDEIPENKKIIVFNEYKLTGKLLQDAMAARKVKAARIFSGTKDKEKELHKFQRDPDTRILILSNASGAVGLNLQQANYIIFFESPTSPMMRKQAIKRAHRGGQTQRVFVWDLVASHTTDKVNLKAVNEGLDLHQSLLEGKVSKDEFLQQVRE